MLYPNNGFASYVNLIYAQYSLATKPFLIKLLRIFPFLKPVIILPILIWRILKDAGIELLFLLIFWVIIMKMSQGRDLIVSLFEPEGLYGGARIFFTTVTVVSFSISMWIIPACMFQLRENVRRKSNATSPFSDHLFFIHRILPLVPFWVLASALFNGYVWVFLLASFAELGLLYLFNHKVKSIVFRWGTMGVIGIALIVLTVYFFRNFQELYTEMKVVYAINLYMMSILVFFIYHEADNGILREHANPGHLAMNVYRRYNVNTITYFVCVVLHILAVMYIYYRPFKFNIAPESILLYMFSVYVFAIDLVFYIINISKLRQLIAASCFMVLALLLISPWWNINVSQYTMDANSKTSFFEGRNRDSFDERYAELRKKIIDNNSDEPYPIILVSGEGGGSRAGLWFSQNLINFDYETGGKFRNHIFSLSTVSGSSVGLSTLFTFWDHTRNVHTIDSAWLEMPADVFSNNYVGSSIRGLLLTDLYKSIVPGNWKNDRNTTLQNEEAWTTEKAVADILKNDNFRDDAPDSALTLKKDFMYFFYENRDGKLSYRENTPIALINTCRSNDGRRGIFSSIKLSDSYFNDAIDIIGYLYEDSICSDDGLKRCQCIKKPISFGQACNTSELFPIFSAPAYIDSLGSFVDGGYHENSGLKSTLDVYQQLKVKLEKDTELAGKKYKIYIMYLKNGSSEKQLYKRIASGPTILQPLTALFSQPFEGSASYFEEKARFVSASDPNVDFLPINLNAKFVIDSKRSGVKESGDKKERRKKKLEPEILKDLIGDIIIREDGKKDTILNFPLARWLSKTIINRIKVNASPDNRGKEATDLLDRIRKVNSIIKPSTEPFQKFPQYNDLKQEADSVVNMNMNVKSKQ